MIKNQGGFIALTSILIVGTVALLIGIGVLLRSIDESNMSLSQDFSFQAQIRADACADYALMRLSENLDYIGNDSIIINGEQCEILAIEDSGNNKIVKVQSTVSGHARKIQIEVEQIETSLGVVSWEEVPDFN